MTWIQERAAELGLTGMDIARRAGVNKTTVYRILSGQRPQRATSDAIAKAMGLDADEVARHTNALAATPKRRVAIPLPWLTDADLLARARERGEDVDAVWREARRRKWSRDQMIEAFEVKL